MTGLNKGAYTLRITALDFVEKRFPIELADEDLDIGKIHLERDIIKERTDNLITLNELELSNDEEVISGAAHLQATRDIYLSRAAFDFSQAFFKIRGYDSREATILLNGHKMNKLSDGRAQWNNWGGLNDVTRNQELSFGLKAARLSFGELLGVTNIDTRPSVLRPGIRVSASVANRTYAGRLMATYNSGKSDKGWAYAISGSRRWGNEGFVEGTFYSAYSIFGSLEHIINRRNSLHLTAIFASNTRGQSAAITDEVFTLEGSRYNPFWGYQNGKVRNSRIRKIQEPILMLNYSHLSEKIRLNTGIAYQIGGRTKSRLGYFNAPNPDPTYYRYLPSYYFNSAIGPNFSNAALAQEGFKENAQIDWDRIYRVNTLENEDRSASYLLYDDVVDEGIFSLKGTVNLKPSPALNLDAGITFRQSNSKNYSRINDLLGAQRHDDIDPFSNTLNDLEGNTTKEPGDIFNYNYNFNAKEIDGFLQLKLVKEKWDAFISGRLIRSSFYRKGIYLNERYPQNSLGKSKVVDFLNFGIKTGVVFNFSARHWVAVNATYFKRPPTLKNTFINPREHNTTVANISNAEISSIDLGYHFRFQDLKGRITGYYTRIQDDMNINFFFVDTGLGSDFVQEVITDMDKLHLGLEISCAYQMSSAVRLTFAGSVAKYLFAGDPQINIYFDPNGQRNDIISEKGYADLGMATIKDYKLPQGPQKAYSLGLDYRDPKYWWLGMTANHLANNYVSISNIRRTSSFLLDPKTSHIATNASEEKIAQLLKQNKLPDFYLLNITGGKSWLSDGKYISVFVSINNVFNTVFKTGGYEQGRNGNFNQLAHDNLGGSPSFGPKYWYGFGRTFFLNLAVSF
ncbi:TonB-dependent receptor [Muriicola sp. Z0-33]|uniref:TonB-dependent receptor n=1 Tax=Muriicola sp. Z0-33 TaxID=2816957 RepID=UPI002237E1A9|nr:TonB-dependent receptor [Muriicola sp. Z0-33]MCW5514920.1 TonB-dependent receptor [Muriicola sp. Z0-33]